jgi:hypothetical protein
MVAISSDNKVDSMNTLKSLKGLIPNDSSDRSTLRPIAEPRWRVRKRAPLQLREAIPLWFALSSPLTGLILGFLGAWFVTWLTNWESAQQNYFIEKKV